MMNLDKYLVGRMHKHEKSSLFRACIGARLMSSFRGAGRLLWGVYSGLWKIADIRNELMFIGRKFW